MINTFDLNEIQKLFGFQLHIYEIMPTNAFEPVLYRFKGNLHPKIANEILKDYIPVGINGNINKINGLKDGKLQQDIFFRKERR